MWVVARLIQRRLVGLVGSDEDLVDQCRYPWRVVGFVSRGSRVGEEDDEVDLGSLGGRQSLQERAYCGGEVLFALAVDCEDADTEFWWCYYRGGEGGGERVLGYE